MNNKIENKLLLIRAEDYASKIDGVSNMVISFVDNTKYIWHRKILADIYSCKTKSKLKTYALPLK